MKNNFISTLSFHKRPVNFPISFPQEQILKAKMNDPEQSDKNLKPGLQNRVNKSGRTIFTTKTSQKTTPYQYQLSSSLRELNIQRFNQKLQTLQPSMAYSPIKSQRSSPCSAKQNASTDQKDPNLKSLQHLPIRSTLKNNIAIKSPPTDSNITKEASYMHSNRQRYTPLHQLKIENQRLQQQNAFLKRQLGQIKKNLIFGPAIKKEESDNNIKETNLKKQYSDNFELKLKLELFTKKSRSLQSLVFSKDEQISFLKNKIHRIEEDLIRCKNQNASELDTLQQKIADVLKSYQDLEIKMTRQEADQQLYRLRWQEEKSLHRDRIAFLQNYIAQNT